MNVKAKKSKPITFLIATLLLGSGLILLATSIFLNSQIICFIALSLTFWGVLFILVTPQKLVEGTFLVTSTLPIYMTIDRMLRDLKSKNEAYNIPSYAKDVPLPEYIQGLKEMVTFIPAENTSGMASIEDIAKGKFLLENPKGLLITPPGIALLNKIEQKRNTDLTKIPLSELDETLTTLLNELHLTTEIKITIIENVVTLQITDSVFKNLYSQEYKIKSINLLGCPLVSAVACAIAKSTAKPTMIQQIETTADDKITVATLKIVQM
jgi:hypothetical protein